MAQRARLWGLGVAAVPRALLSRGSGCALGLGSCSLHLLSSN